MPCCFPGVGVGQHERSGADRRWARVGVGAGQGQRARADLGQAAVARDDAAERLVAAGVDGQGAAVGQLPAIVATTEDTRAASCSVPARDRRHARVGVGSVEHQQARARLLEGTRAADAGRAEVRPLGHRVAAVENERPVIGDGAAGRECAGGAAVADLQGSRADRRAAAIGIRAGQDQFAAAAEDHRITTLPLPLMPPPMVNKLPVAAVTLRLLPNVIGVSIVLLPPLLLIVADPPVAVLDKVNVLAPDGLIT